MEVTGTEKAASVVLVRVSLSEDELEVYEACLNYALEGLDDVTIKRCFGASRDEIEGMRDDVRDILTRHGETSNAPALAGKH